MSQTESEILQSRFPLLIIWRKTQWRVLFIMDKKSGVYKITNNRTGHYYIGSSYKLSVRRNRHKWELKNNRHPNAHMQNAFNKYGEDCFSFEILLYCSKEETLKNEQEILDESFKKDGRKLYNVAKDTLAPMAGITSPNKGKKFSDETRKKMSISHTGKPSNALGHKFSPESLARLSESHKGLFDGEKNPMAKFTREQVDEIREMYLGGFKNVKKMAEKYNCSESGIKNIIYNKRWYDEEYEKRRAAK